MFRNRIQSSGGGKRYINELFNASANGNRRVVENLLREKKVDVNVEHENFSNFTPLIFASRNGHAEVVEMLLKYGAKIYKPGNMRKETAIHWACYDGKLECLKVLLNYDKSFIDFQNVTGDTALHDSSERGHYECVKYLLESGAKSNILNNDMKYARDLSKNDITRKIFEKCESVEGSVIEYENILRICTEAIISPIQLTEEIEEKDEEIIEEEIEEERSNKVIIRSENGYFNLLAREILTDYVVGNIKVHKLIFCRSHAIKKMIYENPAGQVKVERCSSEVLKNVIFFLYGVIPVIKLRNLSQVYRLAHKWRLARLKLYCCDQITLENIIPLLNFSNSMKSRFHSILLHFFKINFSVLIQKKEMEYIKDSRILLQISRLLLKRDGFEKKKGEDHNYISSYSSSSSQNKIIEKWASMNYEANVDPLELLKKHVSQLYSLREKGSSFVLISKSMERFQVHPIIIFASSKFVRDLYFEQNKSRNNYFEKGFSDTLRRQEGSHGQVLRDVNTLKLPFTSQAIRMLIDWAYKSQISDEFLVSEMISVHELFRMNGNDTEVLLNIILRQKMMIEQILKKERKEVENL